MIGYLSGYILDKNVNSMILNVNGVGYEISIPLSSYYKLEEINALVSIHIHMVTRDGASSLYGFITKPEKSIFIKLISIAGIGPKLALSILSRIDLVEFVSAIKLGQVDKLYLIPGIGKKTAERIVIELKDKIISDQDSFEFKPSSEVSLLTDIVSALVNLGWQEITAKKVAEQCLQEENNKEFNHIIKVAIKRLYK